MSKSKKDCNPRPAQTGALFPALVAQPSHLSLVNELAVGLLPGMPPEALGVRYQEWLARDVRQQGGSFFTPPALAERLAQAILSPLLTSPEQLPVVFDPSCGAGWFLFAAYRIMADFLASQTPDQKLSPPQRKRILSHLKGMDCDPIACELARIGLRQLADLPKASPEIIEGNSLKEPWPACTVILGNPPYVRVQKQEERLGQDTYLAFVEKTLDHLHEGCRAGLIVPNRILTARYAAGVRKKIATNRHLISVEDLGGSQVFTGASTYVCLLGLSGDPCLVARLQRGDEVAWLQADSLLADPWPLRTGAGAPLETRLSRQPELETEAHLFVGVQTSADRVFHLPKGSENSLLERQLSLPLVSGGDIRPFHAPSARSEILFPYVVENQQVRLLGEDELASRFPRAWAYLLGHKALLEARENGRFAGKDWYRYGRTQNLGIQAGPKGVVPRLVRRLCAGLDAGDAVLDNADVLGVRSKGRIPLIGLVGLLNSRVWGWYLRRISAPFRGGYVTANRQYLGRMPVPELDEAGVSELCRLAAAGEGAQPLLDRFVEDALGIGARERELLGG